MSPNGVPTNLALQTHVPFVKHWSDFDPVLSQLQFLQSGNPKKSGLHFVHWRPITFGLQEHCPPILAHTDVCPASVPSLSHSHKSAPLLKSAATLRTASLQYPVGFTLTLHEILLNTYCSMCYLLPSTSGLRKK